MTVLEKHGKTLRSNLESFDMKIPVCVLVYMGRCVLSVSPFLFASSFSSKQQSQPKSASEKSQRSKKAKELKPKVKKLKYHQYIPPDQKQDKGAPPMDSSYAKILQQQQLFLQLQILNQQQQHYNYQTILPAPPKYGS